MKFKRVPFVETKCSTVLYRQNADMFFIKNVFGNKCKLTKNVHFVENICKIMKLDVWNYILK